MTDPRLVTQSEFSREIGKDKSYVTRLKEGGRLVMVERDGKSLVDVEASLKKIEETASPGHADVGKNSPRKGVGGAHDNAPGHQPHNSSFNAAKAREMAAKAEIAEMEAAKMRGSLVNAEQVQLFAADLGASFRAALEILPDRLAPELVPLSDVDAVRAVLVENFEVLLRDISMKIERGIS